MVAYEIKKQCKAFYEVFDMEKPNGMTENTFLKIRAKVMMEWGEMDSNDMIIEIDWTMVLYEMEEQIKAYKDIFK